MAVTIIDHINSPEHLKNAINYIQNILKTDGGKWIGALNCNKGFEYQTMRDTQKNNKMSGSRTGYHIKISCPGKECSPEVMLQIMRRFSEQFLGFEYEASYAVHTNTPNIHGHLIFNSVNRMTGYKYRYQLGDWGRKIQPIVNGLCREFGLKEMNVNGLYFSGEKEKGKNNGDAKDSFQPMIRKDIDYSIAKAKSFDEFVSLLKSMGYKVFNTNGEGKYIKIKGPGMERWRRLKALGTEYCEERIRERIQESSVTWKEENYIKERQQRVRGHTRSIHQNKYKPWSPVRKKYYAKLYRIGKIKRMPYSQAWKYRESIKNFNALQLQYQFLCENDIRSVGDLIEKRKEAEREHNELKEARKEIYRERSTVKPVLDAFRTILLFEESEKLWNLGRKELAESHAMYQEQISIMKQSGYSLPEAKNLYLTLHQRLSNICKQEFAARSKVNMIHDMEVESFKKAIEKEKSYEKRR